MEELNEDVKVINEANDLFGTYDKAEIVREFLELDTNKELLGKNNLIAIYGEWGSGKSCLMKTIFEKLDSKKFEKKWFDTWKYEKDNNLAYSLFKYIGKDNFWNDFKGKSESFLNNIYGIFKSFSKGIEVNIPGFTFNPGESLDCAEQEEFKKEDKYDKEKCLWEKVEEFESEFRKIKFKGDRRLVVFLDDLDRCESENIITLISAIKLLLSINENIIFIIGIDKEAVTLALRNKYNNDYNKADEYLEKIFPINFEVSNDLKNENILKYISVILGNDIENIEIILDFLNKIQFKNARHIKKILRKYYLIKNYLQSKGVDVKNKYNVILILYMMILNIFYNDEYKYFIMEDKEKIYNKLTLVHYDNRTGLSQRAGYQMYKKACNINYEDGKNYDIYQLLIKFSSHKIIKDELESILYMSGDANIGYEDVLNLFENNICKDFIEFISNNEGMLEYISIDNHYNEEKINNLINIIKNIL